MSKIDVRCPDCSQPYRVPATAAGKKIACRKCNAQIRIPEPVVEVEVVEEIPKRKPTPKKQPRRAKPQSGQPARRSSGGERPQRRPPRKRRPTVVEDFEEVDEYDDYGDDFDAYDDYDEYGSRGGRRTRKKARGGGAVKFARVGVLVLAISLSVRTLGYAGLLIAKLIGTFGDNATVSTLRILDAVSGPDKSVQVLLKIDIWLTFLAILGMIAAYILFLLAPDREGSQGWAIASLVLAVIACGLVFYLRVLPLIDRDSMASITRFLSGGRSKFSFGRSDMGDVILEITFKTFMIAVLVVIHLLLAVMYVKKFASGSKSSEIERRCSLPLASMMAHLGAQFLSVMMLVFFIKVVVPAAVEAREPPSKIWQYLMSGLDWAVVLSFLVFLIVSLRLTFSAQSRWGT